MIKIKEKSYKKTINLIRSYKYGIKIINLINIVSATIIYLLYPFSLLVLAIKGDASFWKLLLIPGISFIILSIIRKWIDAPRPYELFKIRPIIKKETRGSSFPSRHVFSAFVIGMSIYYISNPLGLIIMILGSLLSIVRVISGVHFPKDVIVGGLVGILCAIIGWNLIG